jgi:peptide-methionine (S)-S-oxide reductase
MREDLDRRFESAVRAIDAGDLAALERELAEYPALAHRRLEQPGKWLRRQIGPALDGFLKAPYLLWLLTEDAPRTRRLAPNVGALARAIIAKARAQAAPELQHLLESTLHFAVCSPIGRDDGRQLELLDALIDAGAALDGAPMQAMVCGNEAAAEHLLARGAPLDLQAAVSLGRWEALPRLARTATVAQKQMALALAALNGKTEGLRRLLPYGVELNEYSTGFYTHATPVHHAVWSGVLEAVQLLVEAGARLDFKDKAYGGTPLGWAEHALSGGAPDPTRQYAEIAAWLRARGAPA